MKKNEVQAVFKELLTPEQKAKGKEDPSTLRELWNVFTDHLHKSGDITTTQYMTWSNPYDQREKMTA